MIAEDDHVLVIYYQSYVVSDYLGAIVREGGPDGRLAFRYRFRYYADPIDDKFDPFDGRDEKNEYRLVPKEQLSDEQMIARIDPIISEMARIHEECGDLQINDRVIVNGGGETLMAALAKQSWVHMKIEASEHFE